jgi:diguanylate cyclase (GGDEF) domain
VTPCQDVPGHAHIGFSKRMKVLLVDDHGLFRHGLEMLLSGQNIFREVLHAATGQEALALQAQHSDIDLVLLDYNLGTDHGLDVLLQLKQRDPALPIAMVSGRDDPQVILSALGSGASGFIQKNLEPDDIVAAIQLVLDGGIYVPPTVLTGSRNKTPVEHKLTRQKQLQHLAEIARRVIREKNLDVRQQADIESEMTSALNRLVMELQQDRTRLEVLAFQDDLTGVANRRLFLERLEQALRNSRRSKTQMALVYLDLDYFKQINDSLGHQAGDILLKETAQRLMRSVREVDTVARLGGDEFTLVLVDIQSEEGLHSQLTRLRSTLKKPVVLEDGQECTPSASIGAAISDGSESAADLMKRADESLYEVKASGRDNFVVAPVRGG